MMDAASSSFIHIGPLSSLSSHTRYTLSLRTKSKTSPIQYHRLLLFRLNSSTTGAGAGIGTHNGNTNEKPELYCMEATCPHLGAPLSHAEVQTTATETTITHEEDLDLDLDTQLEPELHDIEDTLTHSISDGSTPRRTIVCPWHLYDFELTDSGASSTGMKLCVYPVEVREGGEVFVGAPAAGGGGGEGEGERVEWELVDIKGVSEEFADDGRSGVGVGINGRKPCSNEVATTTSSSASASHPIAFNIDGGDGNLPELPSTLISSALLILQTANPGHKVALTRSATFALRSGGLKSIRPTRRDVQSAEALFGHSSDGTPAPPRDGDDADGNGDEPQAPFVPPRGDVKMVTGWNTERRGKGGSSKGRVAMLHALANIEQWAIDLAWDIIARFGSLKINGEPLPSEFFLDFAKMAEDEAKHFSLLSQRLEELGSFYGSQNAHAGLWDSAIETSHSLLARLAVIHLVAEARGLDVNPLTIEKFRKGGDLESVKMLEVIHNDEITHVTTGHRWFTWICEKLGLDPVETFRKEVRENFKGRVKGPFNTKDRLKAGMSEDYYECLEGNATGHRAEKKLDGGKSRSQSPKKDTETEPHSQSEALQARPTSQSTSQPQLGSKLNDDQEGNPTTIETASERDLENGSETQDISSPTPFKPTARAIADSLPIPSPVPFPETSEILPSNVPTDANDSCPGTESTMAGKSDACDGCPNQTVCAEGPKGPDPDLPLIRERMSGVKRKVLVLSGKGGVGKSTFTAGLSWALAADEDIQTGIMDVDICGPSIPLLMGLENQTIHTSASGWSPAYALDNLAVMSIGFMLASKSDAVIWRGPKKNGLIKQFLKDVEWGDLDYLVVDTPPGTSDEHLSIVQYLKEAGIDGAVLVTTPQEVALQDVRKEIDFCRKVGIPILGVVENMSGFVCPSCKNESQIFIPSTGGAQAMADDLGLELLGKVPLDPRIGMSCDNGLSFLDEYPDSPATTAYLDIVQRIRELLGDA